MSDPAAPEPRPEHSAEPPPDPARTASGPTDPAPTDPAPTDPAPAGPGEDDGGIVTDFSDEDGEQAEELRSAVVTGYGPRWAGVRLP